MRRYFRRTLAALFAVVVVFLAYRVLAVYRFRSLPCEGSFQSPPVAALRPVTLRVMVFNIEGHAALLRGDDHVPAIARVINAAKPDVVAINEAHRGTWQVRFGDQVRDLERATGMRAHFVPSFTVLGGAFGNMILTRHRIMAADAKPLPGTGEPRTLVGATIDVAGSPVEVHVTHLAAWRDLNTETRKSQFGCIASTLRGRPRTIVAGDMNATPDSPELQLFLQRSGMLLAGRDLPPTHKVLGDRIDHVFTSPDWRVLKAVVLDDGPSDHRPVIVDLQGVSP